MRPAGRLAQSRLSALLLLLAGTSARATTVAPLELSQLVTNADRIAVARVEKQEARWTSGRSAIVTQVTLRITQGLKGPLRAGERVEVLREGGELEGTGMLVEGAAQFATGETVLVFLEQRGRGTWTVGMAQGKLRIETRGGRRVLSRDLAGLHFSGRAPAPLTTLDAVLRAIAALASQEQR